MFHGYLKMNPSKKEMCHGKSMMTWGCIVWAGSDRVILAGDSAGGYLSVHALLADDMPGELGVGTSI